jgi:predicted Zn-dependent protease
MRRPGGSRFGGGRILIALVIAAASLITYFSSRVENPITGETQHINISVEQEIALGVQAAPEMAQQYGGLDPDAQAQELVDQIGQRIVSQSAASRSPYQFDFHLLEDNQTINAFALPGGQIFITAALFDRLQTEDQLAGVLGHEVGHVIGRHSAEHIARQQLTNGLTGAAVIAAYDPNDPSTARTAGMAMVVGQLVNMKYGRDDELESDFFGVCFLNEAGYDPQAMIGVMEILAEASQGNAPPEFFSTHPNPENRVENIQYAINNLDQCP